MQADSMVASVSVDTRIVHQQVSSPSAAPTASSSSATATPAASPQPTTAGSTASPAVTSPTTAAAATPAATALSSSTAAAAAPEAADTSSTVPSVGTVANSSETPNGTSTAAGGTVTPISTLQTQLMAPWDLDDMDQVSPPLDGKYEYTNDGTGVNIYILDTVSTHGSLKQHANVPYARAAQMHQSTASAVVIRHALTGPTCMHLSD